jgi:hypothetical protein
MMTFDQFEDHVRNKAMYEAIYRASEGRDILVVTLLGAYTMMNRAALAQPEQEPVAWMQESTGCIRSDWGFDKTGYVPLYTTPPQRKPLTSGELYTAYITATNQTLRPQDERLAFAFARAIEKAHGII